MADRLRLDLLRRFARIDWTLLLIPLIGLVAVWSFLTQSLPSTDDGAFHVLRLVEIDRCLRHGVLPLRWAPDFAHGYGYPFFNYYASLSSYIAELWHVAGLDFPQAIAGATVAAFFVSGWGAYLLGRDLAGRKAGLVAATAYMYAPYQFHDSAYRGNLAEMWALALLPWVLWTGRRAAKGRRWRDIVPCAVAYAALICTHNIYALIGSPILGLYLLLLWWIEGHTWREARRLGSMIVLGLALSAFFWLPALFERSWVRYSADLVDYRVSFLSVGELLAHPSQVDTSRLNAYPPRSLSWGMLILLALEFILLIVGTGRVKLTRLRSQSRSLAGTEWTFFLAVFLGTSFMSLRASDFMWRTISLLRSAQFPWRYLGIASLASSLVAGAAVAFLPDRPKLKSPALIGTAVAVVLLVTTAIPWTYAAPFPQRQNIGVPEIIGWEYGTQLIGTTAQSEYLPIWSARLPPQPADPALLTEHDPIIARLDQASLPEGATVVSATYSLMRTELVIDTPQAFRALYKQFYFPGWRVTIDGQAVPRFATAPYGLLGFDVPAGEHQIVVQPTTTPLRLLGEGITLLAVITAIAIVTLDRRRREAAPAASTDHPPPREGLRRGHWAFIAVLALLLLGLKEGVIDRTENIFRAHRFDGERVPGVGTETRINFGNVFTLYGYDLPTRPVVAGESLRVDLYLSALLTVDGNYVAYARLVDDEGRLWSLRDNGAPEGFRPPPPTTIWPTDVYGHWAYLAYSLPGTPPGEYWIQVGLFERETWKGLNVLDEQGRIVGLATRIGPVQIASPRRPPDVDALDIDRPLYAAIGQSLRCLGSKQDVRSTRAGGALSLTLFWQAVLPPASDYTVRVALVDGETAFVLGDHLPLGRHDHPTRDWKAGEIVRSPHRLRIRAAIDAGTYAIEAAVMDDQGRLIGAPVRVSEIVVEQSARRIDVPLDIQYRVDANLGQRVTLLGYDIAETRVRRQKPLTVTLYWQARREMDVSYKVFVQLIGPRGVLSQVDTVPVGWTRPTTGWVTGEVIVDPYSLSIPADAPQGAYQLIVGMYGEETLQRLAVLDASGVATGDHVALGEAIVE